MTNNLKQKHIISFLNDSLKKKQTKNKSYSMRAFAKQLGISHSQLSKIFSGKALLSFPLADKILDALDVSLPIKNSLLLSLSDEKNISDTFDEEKVVILNLKQNKILRQWYSLSVICCLQIPTIEPTVSGISKYLGIAPQLVTDTIEVFKILGSIQEVNGQLLYNGTCYRIQKSDDDDEEEQKRNSNEGFQNVIKNMSQSINKDFDNCEFAANTFIMPLSKLPEARRKMTEMRRELAIWMASNDIKDCDNVFKLVVTVFRSINFD